LCLSALEAAFSGDILHSIKVLCAEASLHSSLRRWLQRTCRSLSQIMDLLVVNESSLLSCISTSCPFQLWESCLHTCKVLHRVRSLPIDPLDVLE
jgi:hypothetical protein